MKLVTEILGGSQAETVKEGQGMTIAERILSYLQERKIKQTIFVDGCGWTRQKAFNMLHGKQKITIEEYVMICDALGVQYDYFLKEA